MAVKLFCFPHAGSSASVYKCWSRHLTPDILLIPVELPGRGSRFDTPLYTEFQGLLEDLYSQVAPQLWQEEFAFFGHSMGTLLAFELAHLLRRKGDPLPRHLFFSGRNAPQFPSKELDGTLPEPELITILEKLEGSTIEVFANKELREIFMPIIRADLVVVNDYHCPENRPPLDIDFSILHGDDDFLLTDAKLEAWDAYTANTCTRQSYPGGHMYLKNMQARVTGFVKSMLIPQGT